MRGGRGPIKKCRPSGLGQRAGVAEFQRQFYERQRRSRGFETLLLRFWRIERATDEWRLAWLAWDAEIRLKREREIALRESRRRRRASPPDPPP